MPLRVALFTVSAQRARDPQGGSGMPTVLSMPILLYPKFAVETFAGFMQI